ncbi:MAG: hypothetical protein PHI55_14465 [Burkholderiaceae bacterium]|nr:hypothetical protein [Burkholderiaceae bacterium]
MTKARFLSAWAATAGVALALLAGSSAAQARDVYWSVGVNSPGVSVGFANGYPVVVANAPVYGVPAPAYYAPPPVAYAPPRPVYYGAPVAYAPAPPAYYDRGGHHGHRHHGHGGGYGERGYDERGYGDRGHGRGHWDRR